MPRPDRRRTLRVLTSHMPEDATFDERCEELPRVWDKETLQLKPGTCQGCDCDKLTRRFWIRKRETGELVYIGSSCITLFEKTAPDFFKMMKPLLDEASLIGKVAKRKIPKELREFASLPFATYGEMKAIDNRTHALWASAVRYCLRKLTDEERTAYSRI